MIKQTLYPTNPKLLNEIDKELARAMIDDEDTLNEILESQVENDTVEQPVTLDTQQEHPPITNADDLVTHMKEMVEQGYTVEQIKSLHPELKDLFNRE
jgi:plasmid rolling circle replication initiator protein Rep